MFCSSQKYRDLTSKQRIDVAKKFKIDSERKRLKKRKNGNRFVFFSKLLNGLRSKYFLLTSLAEENEGEFEEQEQVFKNILIMYKKMKLPFHRFLQPCHYQFIHHLFTIEDVEVETKAMCVTNDTVFSELNCLEKAATKVLDQFIHKQLVQNFQKSV